MDSKTLWIVGRVNSETYWEFLGVFSTEKQAVNACSDIQCFVASAQLNEVLSGDAETWPNVYYPIKEWHEGNNL